MFGAGKKQINILNPACALCEFACVTTIVFVFMFLLVLYHALVGASAPYCSARLCMCSCHCASAAVTCVARADAFITMHYACARECAYLSRTLVHTKSAAI